MSNWQKIGTLEDIPFDSGACALVNNQQVAIFRIKDSEELYAIDNFDPISKANILSRAIIGSIQQEFVIASPMYKQHFSLKTGQCIEKPEFQVKTWSVRVQKGSVEILV